MSPGSTLKECELMQGKRWNDHTCIYIYVACLIDKLVNGDTWKDMFPYPVRGYYVIGDVNRLMSTKGLLPGF